MQCTGLQFLVAIRCTGYLVVNPSHCESFRPQFEGEERENVPPPLHGAMSAKLLGGNYHKYAKTICSSTEGRGLQQSCWAGVSSSHVGQGSPAVMYRRDCNHQIRLTSDHLLSRSELKGKYNN